MTRRSRFAALCGACDETVTTSYPSESHAELAAVAHVQDEHNGDAEVTAVDTTEVDTA